MEWRSGGQNQTNADSQGKLAQSWEPWRSSQPKANAHLNTGHCWSQTEELTAGEEAGGSQHPPWTSSCLWGLTSQGYWQLIRSMDLARVWLYQQEQKDADCWG